MKTWNISVGYGYYNDEDRKDNMTLNLPDQFKKEDIEELIFSNYSKYRTVSVKVERERRTN